LQVIFRNRATNYRALLQEITYKDKASYGSSPPCTSLRNICSHNLYLGEDIFPHIREKENISSSMRESFYRESISSSMRKICSHNLDLGKDIFPHIRESISSPVRKF